MKNSTKILGFIVLVLIGQMLPAQYSEKKINKLVDEINENIEIIRQNRLEFQQLEKEETDEYYIREYSSYISPFWNYDFEVLEKINIDKNGEISWKVKYMPKNEEAFIYTVHGNIQDLERAAIDIYFILEFAPDALEATYEYLDSGKMETLTDDIIHFGIDQKGLSWTAEQAGVEVYGY